jgi:hypothetical protein
VHRDLVAIVFFLIFPAIFIGTPIARAWARRLERGSDPPRLPPDLTARMERMEQGIDSIAIEVERISEGLRFTTKLLADRAASGDSPSDRKRSVPGG